MTAVETITRGIRLTPRLWKELDRRRRQHGSFEAALWALVHTNGDNKRLESEIATMPSGVKGRK